MVGADTWKATARGLPWFMGKRWQKAKQCKTQLICTSHKNVDLHPSLDVPGMASLHKPFEVPGMNRAHHGCALRC